MKRSGKVNLCVDHLVEVVRGLKRDDVLLIDQIDHQLTPVDLCAVCIYPVNAHNEGSDALDYLLQQGYVAIHAANIRTHTTGYWVNRVIYFLSLVVAVFLLEGAVRFLFTGNGSLSAATFLDFLLVAVVSLVLFNLLDEKFFR